jgi:hypothetical protein
MWQGGVRIPGKGCSKIQEINGTATDTIIPLVTSNPIKNNHTSSSKVLDIAKSRPSL